MSEEKPCRWGVTVNGAPNKTVGRFRVTDGPKKLTFSTRPLALQCAAKFSDWQEARLVRLRPKKKPTVVARYELEGIVSTDASAPRIGNRWIDIAWLSNKSGKRVRLTMEELRDD